ncbi:metal-dependent phosphohydrolase [Kosmotoga arenicorallina S304]|uniref:Metal-dependent phosphohydrolase n=1 Tax=Kosmotoga arenicorallina S304 TaxID=1453497 RepID=A0A176K020_9BACT|nr:HD domain-containing protein [Kosmotoga arenicorallina]OAA29762.1 metal-dependent phosphohydrolase [Kosmotoga arenicorallina S304]
MYFKVSRDPIYTEIYLYPLEILFMDTKPVQRLRFLSQLAGAETVYPGASHTRLSHSMGTMHIAGMYARHLFPDNLEKERILRLAGLLHDIGHGPYSHQFDDAVFSKAGFEHGHDTYRKRILLEYYPDILQKHYENIKDEKLKAAINTELEAIIGEKVEFSEAVEELLERINEVFEGELEGSLDFNIIQGPLGADRLDFVLRDSYFAGTRYFGTGSPERIIRGAMVIDKNKLAYSLKVIDDIYTTLFSRFMMYKNVYFHKTARAADLMIQDILRFSYNPLNLPERLEKIVDFLQLTDNMLLDEVELRFNELIKKLAAKMKDNERKVKNHLLSRELDSELAPNEKELLQAYINVERFRERNLWKLIMEISFSTTGVDPSVVSGSVAQDALSKMKLKLEEAREKAENADKKILLELLTDFDDLFRIDTPYKLSLAHPDEFLSSNVYLFDDKLGDILNFEQFEKRYPAYHLISNNLIQIVRIYCVKDIRWLLRKYEIVPEVSRIDITTRW